MGENRRPVPRSKRGSGFCCKITNKFGTEKQKWSYKGGKSGKIRENWGKRKIILIREKQENLPQNKTTRKKGKFSTRNSEEKEKSN
jgi:hypothetical protein